jgi:hypothetical protein
MNFVMKPRPISPIEPMSHKSLACDLREGFDEGFGKQSPSCSGDIGTEKEGRLRKQAKALPMSNRPVTTIQCGGHESDRAQCPDFPADLDFD